MFKKARSQKNVLALIATFLLLISAYTVVLRAKAIGNREPNGGARAQQGPPSPPQTTPLLVRVFVHEDDVYPDLIHTRPGLVRLRVENETAGDVVLALDPGGGQQFTAQVVTTGQAKRADGIVLLSEGEYIYFEASRPEVTGKLIVR